MVQKYQSPVRVYKHPFELVMAVSIFSVTNHFVIKILLFFASYKYVLVKAGFGF